jgi:hypothetical protein
MKLTTHLHLGMWLRMNGAIPLLPLHALMTCTGTSTAIRLTLQTYNKQRRRPSMYVKLKDNEINHHISKICTNACHSSVDVDRLSCHFILPSTQTSRKVSVAFKDTPRFALAAVLCQMLPHHDLNVTSGFHRCVHEIWAILGFTQRRMAVTDVSGQHIGPDRLCQNVGNISF